MCWGHAARPRDAVEANAKINDFFDRYFDRVEPDEHDGPTMTFKLNWKSAVVPNLEWPEYFLKPENKHLRLIMFIIMGERISFPLGIIFPIPLNDSASCDFLRRFSADAPFKMSAKHFSVVVPIGKGRKYAARRPGAEITSRLSELFHDR